MQEDDRRATQQRVLHKEGRCPWCGGQEPSQEATRQQAARAVSRPGRSRSEAPEGCLKMERATVNLMCWWHCNRKKRESQQTIRGHSKQPQTQP